MIGPHGVHPWIVASSIFEDRPTRQPTFAAGTAVAGTRSRYRSQIATKSAKRTSNASTITGSKCLPESSRISLCATVRRVRRLIRPHGSQGIENIGQRQDPCGQGNILAAEGFGVARPVESFVVEPAMSAAIAKKLPLSLCKTTSSRTLPPKTECILTISNSSGVRRPA